MRDTQDALDLAIQARDDAESDLNEADFALNKA